MRLWHKDLIHVLPDKQLLGQWRECCAIASNIANKGTPNHILVNKIMDYPLGHFYRYAELVNIEMNRRGFVSDFRKFYDRMLELDFDSMNIVSMGDLFSGWHNRRYLIQCIYNLQEKYDCDGIKDEDWSKLLKYFESIGIYLKAFRSF